LGPLQTLLDANNELIATIERRRNGIYDAENQRKRPEYLTFFICMDVGSTPAASTNVLFIYNFK